MISQSLFIVTHKFLACHKRRGPMKRSTRSRTRLISATARIKTLQLDKGVR